jgi:predicted transcriptional regulator
MTRDILLLSIRPQYADKIFDGTKTVELRRIRPKLEAGDWVLVYVSTPVQALIGMFQVDRVEESSPNRLWTQVRGQAGVTRKEFDLYYMGADRAYGIFLKTTRQLPQPINLEYLKQVLSGFQPPQSYRYLTQDEIRLVDNEGQRFSMHQASRRTLP